MNAQVIYASLRFLYGALFIASAVLKVFPIDYFELVLVNQVGMSWVLVPIFARLLILAEFALGAAIMAGWKLRWSLILSLVMLMVFSIYLAAQIASGNGAEDCGCFGELIPLDGPSSLLKNILFIGLGGFLLFKSNAAQRFTWWPAGLIVSVLAIPALFLIFPLPEFEPDADFQLDTELLVRNDPYEVQPLDEGDRLVIVMLAKCAHCAQLGSFIATLDPEEVNDKLRIIVLGTEDSYQFFIHKTGIQEFVHGRSTDNELIRAIEGKFPTAIHMKDGVFLNKWKGAAVNIALLNEHLELN